MKYLIFVFFLIIINNTHAKDLTRTEISIMHKMGVRMALSGEKAYIVPLSISPSRLIKTELLDFSGKKMKKLPDWISSFKKLRKLDLNNTGIEVYDSFKKLSRYKIGKKLEVLNVSGGTFESSDRDEYAEKNNYRMDDYPENDNYSIVGKNLWDSLPNLRELDISNIHSASWLNLQHISRLKKIIKLNLNKTDFSGPLWFGEPHLSYLRLGKMNTIRELDLSEISMDIEDISVNDIPDGVEKLFISGNNGSKLNDSFGDLFSLPNLVQLKVDSHVKIPDNLKKKLSDI